MQQINSCHGEDGVAEYNKFSYILMDVLCVYDI